MKERGKACPREIGDKKKKRVERKESKEGESPRSQEGWDLEFPPAIRENCQRFPVKRL